MNNHINKIILFGFRGTGKTSAGRLLAKKLGWKFIDTDEFIVKKSGKSIYSLTNGGKNWKSFRNLESRTFKTLLAKKDIIISTGGGLLVNEIKGKTNAAEARKDTNSLLILLTADEKTIQKRIAKELRAGNISKMPALDPTLAKRLTKLEKKEIIELLLEDSIKTYRLRKPLYKKINSLSISTSASRPLDVAKQIAKKL